MDALQELQRSLEGQVALLEQSVETLASRLDTLSERSGQQVLSLGDNQTALKGLQEEIVFAVTDPTFIHRPPPESLAPLLQQQKLEIQQLEAELESLQESP